MPHAEILRMMQLMDSIREAWGIEFPFEMDNTIRITAQDIAPGRKSSVVRTDDDKAQKKPGSVVRKISETSDKISKEEEREEKAKDAREKPGRGHDDEKSATQKLKDPGDRLKIEEGSSEPGSVTEKIQHIVIDDDDRPVDKRSLTGKLRDLSLDEDTVLPYTDYRKLK